MLSVIALVVLVGLVHAQQPPCCTGKQWEANEFYQLGTVEGGKPRYIEVSPALVLFYYINSLPHVKFFMLFSRLLIVFQFKFFEKLFQVYHLSVKQIGSRSGPTKRRA